jgi:hypothetical protein
MAIPEILQYLLQYLIAHPDAKDTLQGILRWWFPGNMDREETEVQEALDLLVARSWLTQRRTTPSRTLYGLNKKKLEEIKVFLREREREAEGHRE